MEANHTILSGGRPRHSHAALSATNSKPRSKGQVGQSRRYASTRGYVGSRPANDYAVHEIRYFDQSAHLLVRRSAVPQELRGALEWVRSVPASFGYPDLELVIAVDELEMVASNDIRSLGKGFRPGPPVSDRGPLGACFRNAAELVASASGELQYAEGLALPLDIRGVGKGFGVVCWHGWAVDREGRAVDPTWRNGHWYHGASMPPSIAEEVLERGFGLGHDLSQALNAPKDE